MGSLPGYDRQSWRRIRRAQVDLLRYAVLTAAAALLVEFFRKVAAANQTTVALTLLMLVLITASRWRLAYSVYLSVVCALLYDFYFLPPVGHWTVAD